MSSYETLLENYLEEKSYENDTFSNVAACLESLTSFANEEVNFEMVITLEEAESGSIKDKAAKLGATVKKTIHNLIEKLTNFITKIKEAVKRFVAKAKTVIAQKGNEALKKMVATDEYVTGKAINLTVFESNGLRGKGLINNIFSQVDKALAKATNVAKSYSLDQETIEMGDDITNVIKAFSEDFAKSKMAKSDPVGAIQSVRGVYKQYIAPYLDATNEMIKGVEKAEKEALDACNAVIKELKKAENGKSVNAASISAVSKLSTQIMQLTTATLNFAMSVLTVTAKNSAKLALCAVTAKGKEKVNNATTTVKNKANAAKDAVASKFKKKED